MSIRVLEESTVEYNIYAVTSNPDDEIELNDTCRKAVGFKDKQIAIGYAICIAENFEYTDVFVTELRTENNYWNVNDSVTNEKIIWSCMKLDDNDDVVEDDSEITDETDELVDSEE